MLETSGRNDGGSETRAEHASRRNAHRGGVRDPRRTRLTYIGRRVVPLMLTGEGASSNLQNETNLGVIARLAREVTLGRPLDTRSTALACFLRRASGVVPASAAAAQARPRARCSAIRSSGLRRPQAACRAAAAATRLAVGSARGDRLRRGPFCASILCRDAPWSAADLVRELVAGHRHQKPDEVFGLLHLVLTEAAR